MRTVAAMVASGALVASLGAQPAARRPATASSTDSLARVLLAELVAANTTESTGATTPVAQKLAARFRAAGFPAADVMVIGPDATHGNLVVRWRGRSRSKPIVFNAHLDVVEAPRLDWATDPFRLTERAGVLYGRGVLDDKGPAAAMAAAWIDARRSGMVPQRDLVLTFTAGEESGVQNGVQWLLAKHRALVDAEYVVSIDAGGAEMAGGQVRTFALQAAEKVYMDLALTARGPGGHSSVPDGDTPIDHLARALERLGRMQFPVQLNPVVRANLSRRAPLVGGAMGEAMGAFSRNPGDLSALATLLGDASQRAALRTTCIATMLRGGTAPNAIPQEVAATVNCRILPGESGDSVITAIRRAIDDTAVVVSVLSPAIPSDPSTASPEIIAMFERVVGTVAAGTPVIPYMENGATDGLYFRNAGIPVFGATGYFISEEAFARMHGRNEGIPVAAFRTMVRYSRELLSEVAGGNATRGGAK